MIPWNLSTRNVMVLFSSYKVFNYWAQFSWEGDLRYIAPEIRHLKEFNIQQLTYDYDEDKFVTYNLGVCALRCLTLQSEADFLATALDAKRLDEAVARVQDADLRLALENCLLADPKARWGYSEFQKFFRSRLHNIYWDQQRDNLEGVFRRMSRVPFPLGDVQISENRKLYLDNDNKFYSQDDYKVELLRHSQTYKLSTKQYEAFGQHCQVEFYNYLKATVALLQTRQITYISEFLQVLLD